jgi:hypothetical protein
MTSAVDASVELAYDDGGYERGWFKGAQGVGGYDAVRFSHSFEISVIHTVRYYIKARPMTFGVLILDSDRNSVYEKEFTPKTAGWVTVDLTQEHILMKGDFYAAMKWTVAEAPELGADESKPDGRSFFVDDGDWKTYREVNLEVNNSDRDGDLMIRVEVAPASVTATVSQFVTCKGLDETKTLSEAVDVTDTFLTTDTEVNALLVLEDVQPPITVRIAYYLPNGEEFSQGSQTFKSGTTVAFAVYHQISDLAGYTGTWRVEAYADEILVSTIRFELTPAVVLHINRVVAQPSTEESFYVGDVGTMTFTIENRGEVVGKNVEIKVVSAPAEIEVIQVSEARDLEPGAAEDWQVKLKATKPGSYEVHVRFYLNGEMATAEWTDAEGRTATIRDFTIGPIEVSESPFPLYAVAGLAVLAVIIVLLVMRKRHRTAAPAVPSSPVVQTIEPPPHQAAGRYCVNCGSAIPQMSTFCPRCGSEQPQAQD